jgi:hypothetical protein
MLHCYIITAGTKAIMTQLRNDVNYDPLDELKIRQAMPPLNTYCKFVWQDPATFLNLYLPLRLHPMTR